MGAEVAARLSELGLSLPTVVAPVGSYVPALRVGDTVMTSGQLPMIDGTLPATGKVGADAEVSAERAAELARVCALNGLAAIESVGVDLDAIRLVKVVGFVASAAGFSQQPVVINGASDLLVDVLGDRGLHARSAVGVAELPLNAPVEIEFTAQVL